MDIEDVKQIFELLKKIDNEDFRIQLSKTMNIFDDFLVDGKDINKFFEFYRYFDRLFGEFEGITNDEDLCKFFKVVKEQVENEIANPLLNFVERVVGLYRNKFDIEEDYEDIRQDSLFRIITKKEQLKGKFNFWAVRIIRNQVYYYLRSKFRKMVKFALMDEVIYSENQNIKSEFLEIAKQEINRLPNKQKQIIHLKYLEQMSSKEIARVLGTSVSSIDTQACYAREKLAKKLQRYMEEYDD